MSDCQYCVHDHAPADGYPGKCPFYGSAQAWKPARPRPPSIEQQHAFAMREIELRIAQENRERQREQERLDRKNTLERARVQQMMKDVHQAQKEALEEKMAQNKAAMDEARVFIEAQKQASRLARRVAQRQARRLERMAQERGKAQTGETFFDKDYTSRHALEVKLSTGSTKEVT
jgi:hypothetical protein